MHAHYSIRCSALSDQFSAYLRTVNMYSESSEYPSISSKMGFTRSEPMRIPVIVHTADCSNGSISSFDSYSYLSNSYDSAYESKVCPPLTIK